MRCTGTRCGEIRRARAYLAERGLPDWVVRACGLGYADGRSLEAHLRKHGGLRVAEDLGLLRRPEPGEGGRMLRERFAGRIVIPELRGGQPIWFLGRHPPTRDARVKYLGLPGEKPILGFERAAGRREVYLIEGAFDWLTAVSWQLPAFSTCGTDFPPDRLGWLARAHVIFGVLDGDRAGVRQPNASERHSGGAGCRWGCLKASDLNDLGRSRAEGACSFGWLRPHGKQPARAQKRLRKRTRAMAERCKHCVFPEAARTGVTRNTEPRAEAWLMLRVHIKRNAPKTREPAQQLLEVVTPRTNTALISPAEHLCASLTLQTRGPGGGPVAFEIVADGERSRFLVRTESNLKQRQLQGQVGAAYPQAALRSLELATLPMGDPVQIGPHEQMASYTLGLRAATIFRFEHSRTATWTRTRRRPDRPGARSLGALDGPARLAGGRFARWCCSSRRQRTGRAAYQRLALEHPCPGRTIRPERCRNFAYQRHIHPRVWAFAALVGGSTRGAHGSMATGGRSRLLRWAAGGRRIGPGRLSAFGGANCMIRRLVQEKLRRVRPAAPKCVWQLSRRTHAATDAVGPVSIASPSAYRRSPLPRVIALCRDACGARALICGFSRRSGGRVC